MESGKFTTMESLPLCDDQQRLPWLPPGFRFHPTDEELVAFYLSKKIEDAHFTVPQIAEADLNKNEPWELLAGRATIAEKEWYFYSVRHRKYPTGVRANRATQAGYWKTTGKDHEVINTKSGRVLGLKKTLVFYMGRAPGGKKTDWVMHEYNKMESYVKVREWVLCRVFFKESKGKKDVPPKVQQKFSDTSYTISNHSNPLLEMQMSNAPLSSPISISPTNNTPLFFLDAISSSSYYPLKFSSHEKIPQDIIHNHNYTPQDFGTIPFAQFTQEEFVSANTMHVAKGLISNRTSQIEEKLHWKEFDLERNIETTTTFKTLQNILIETSLNKE